MSRDMCFSIGTAHNGINAEMQAMGGMEGFLFKGASKTLFRFRFRKYTYFCMDPVLEPLTGDVKFGGKAKHTYEYVGDLASFTYAQIRLPGITACRRGESFQFCKSNVCRTGGQYAVAPRSGPRNTWVRPSAMQDPEDFAALGQDYANWLNRNNGACISQQKDQELFSDCSSIFEDSDDKVWCHWHNAIGQMIMKQTTLLCGQHWADTLFSEYLFIWEEVSGKAGKKLSEMIGKRKTRRALIEDSKYDRILYVPLPFSYTLTPGNALALINLVGTGFHLHFQFESLSNLVTISDPDVQIYKSATGELLTDKDLDIVLDTTYIHLSDEEREKFANADFNQLQTQTQVQFISSRKQKTVSAKLDFQHPVIELLWAVRREVNETYNNFFDYSGIDGRDPIEDVVLKFNNGVRLAGRHGSYYRLVQNFQFHSSIPKSFVYCYSFSLDTESPQPLGSTNFARIENVNISFSLQDGLEFENVTVILIARNFNMYVYEKNTCGIAFA